MHSFVGALRRRARANICDSNTVRSYLVNSYRSLVLTPKVNSPGLNPPVGLENVGFLRALSRSLCSNAGEISSSSRVYSNLALPAVLSRCTSPFTNFSSRRCVTTSVNPVEMATQESSPPAADLPLSPRIKFKRLDKTARHIMQILDKEAVTSVKEQREIVDVKPGYIIQMKVESPENKRRISTIKGIVIARRNAGLNTTFRLRRLVAGVGVESLFPLYSPNIKEIKVLDKKKVRRAKLYYLREKMNALRR